MKTIVWVRKSGTTIDLEDTKNFRKLAKEQGWKKQTAPAPQIELGDNND